MPSRAFVSFPQALLRDANHWHIGLVSMPSRAFVSFPLGRTFRTMASKLTRLNALSGIRLISTLS